MSVEKAPIRNGLRDISIRELVAEPSLLLDTLEKKLEGLPVDARKYGDFAVRMDETARILRAVMTRTYTDISLLALVDLLQAVDYVLVLQDDTPDSLADGYQDDAQKLREVFVKHKMEIDQFRAWHSRQR
jgi:hypothetical protein